MPNWCHNTLRVSGDEADVFRWAQQARTPADPAQDDGSPLYFSSLFPEPKDIGEGWWDWRIANWGTKWEPSFSETFVGDGLASDTNHPDVLRGKGFIQYSFETAWGPPLEWISYVSRKQPALTFQITYGEPGMDFGGRFVIINGEAVKSLEGGAEEFLPKEMLWF